MQVRRGEEEKRGRTNIMKRRRRGGEEGEKRGRRGGERTSWFLFRGWVCCTVCVIACAAVMCCSNILWRVLWRIKFNINNLRCNHINRLCAVAHQINQINQRVYSHTVSFLLLSSSLLSSFLLSSFSSSFCRES